MLRHPQVYAAALALCLTAPAAWGHPTPYGDQFTFSANNFANSFGVVTDPETNQPTNYGGTPATLTFDGIEEVAGEMRVNERAITWPGKIGGFHVFQDAGITDDGVTYYETDLLEWENPGEVLEFSFRSVDGNWIANDVNAQSGFTLDGIDWPHVANDDTPFFYETGFYFYFTDNGVPIDEMSFIVPDLGVLVGPHPFDPSVPEVAYIAYSRGQVNDVTDEYAGGVDIHAGSSQLDEQNGSWSLLEYVLSIVSAPGQSRGNGFHVGYLVDIDTQIDATSGDFNGDDVVDIDDFALLRDHFRQPGGFTDGDINFDGQVDLADFIDFKKSYQLATGQPLQGVPEPTGVALGAIGLAAIAWAARRRTSHRGVAALIACAAVFCSASTGIAQELYHWVPAGPDAANWNSANNWDPALVPSQPLGGPEIGIITNGGRAFIDANLPDGTDPVAGLILGDEADESGALEIRSGGSLGVVQNVGQFGVAWIGQEGRGVLDVLPGGSFAAHELHMDGAADSQINASGNASIVVTTSAALEGVTHLSGPSVNFTADSLRLAGTLSADITTGEHSPIVVAKNALLANPTLKLQFTGHVPSYGDAFALVDAGTIGGQFGAIDATSAPALPRGLEYYVSYDDNAATLLVDNTLILTVDPTDGVAQISNAAGASISFDGYSILSDNGLLSGSWTSLSTSGAAGAGWQTASPTANALSELNLDAAFSLDVGASPLALGSPFDFSAPEDQRDLIFEYARNGIVRRGIVEYADIGGPSGQEGDTDEDDDVDLDDLNAVRNNFGGQGAPDGTLVGDAFPFDGIVDLDDLNGVRNFFGAQPGGSAAVPEPSAWLIASLGALALPVARRRFTR